MKYYDMKEEITEENIVKFVDKWEAKELKLVARSADIPKFPKRGNMMIVVGRTFRDVVLDDSKDVLIEFYSPKCGHCKKLDPIYSELAAKVGHNPNLVIAKIDSLDNILEEFDVIAFPTIFLYPAGKKNNRLTFDGERTVDGFTKFLKEHATHPFTEEQKTDL